MLRNPWALPAQMESLPRSWSLFPADRSSLPWGWSSTSATLRAQLGRPGAKEPHERHRNKNNVCASRGTKTSQAVHGSLNRCVANRGREKQEKELEFVWERLWSSTASPPSRGNTQEGAGAATGGFPWGEVEIHEPGQDGPEGFPGWYFTFPGWYLTLKPFPGVLGESGGGGGVPRCSLALTLNTWLSQSCSQGNVL